jgi:ATP-dependent Clp protease ATP-binding subunit ClpC
LVTGKGGNSKTPTLAECGTDLTQQAADGLLDPVYGRDKEIRSCIRTLIRRRKNNVCLIGDAGVGKTAIAEGVAQILVDPEKCPARLQGYRLVSLELAALVAGTKYRGEFEERLQAIIKEVTDPKAPPTILFLDEIHNLVGAGAAEGGMDAANLLKPALARGEMQIIGATTVVEYRKYVEKDAALERRLQPVMVKEPSVPQTIDILNAVYLNYEKHHGVKYTPEALEAAAVLSDRYITDRFLPDKALDLLDEAGAIAHLENSEMDTVSDDLVIVTEHTMAAVISEWSGIPIGKLEAGEMDRLQTLEYDMTRRVKGQGRAVRGVARAIRRARSGLRDPRRPVASFLFCGPTGTGKCDLADLSFYESGVIVPLGKRAYPSSSCCRQN